ncbi:hypothetical protein [Pseudomonas abietaniphila]|uniref:Uncharacterized protein n=1 Tax=Pseudomonas abietaniphila TaxID=89065 RepID=A0A1G8RQ60_9PSED|nr:hypothetical protein [Pseudomonas abietaniphila]SDJ19108.1 hypothetical protein SAMN05216605_12319 [Pseudomonas abietaniphila]
MIKPAQPKPSQPVGKKIRIVLHNGDGKVTAFLSHADDVVERVATRALSGNALRQPSLKARSARAPHLLTVERELSELKKVVEALAVRSVAKDQPEYSFDVEGMTVLDADVAYRLLDNPPEPNDALRNLLALR